VDVNDQTGRGTRFLLTAASVVVVAVGLHLAQEFLVRVVLAMLLAMACVPPIRRLSRWGFPRWAATFLVLGGAVLGLTLLSLVVKLNVEAFIERAPDFREKVDKVSGDAVAWVEEHLGGWDALLGSRPIGPGMVVDQVILVTQWAAGFLGDVVIVLLLLSFMLAEGIGLPAKIRRAIGDPTADITEYTQIADRVYAYLNVKIWMSMVTGLLVLILTWACGLELPVLWGLIAFLMNFIPNIGSILASIPAILLAWAFDGFGLAAVVGAGYVGINMLIGNLIEPRVMGRKMGLSTVVVLLSLLFWYMTWGPIGMLLSVPLTMVIKIALEHSDDLRWVAILLGPTDTEAAAQASTQSASDAT
jgi:predicted PurR-regulated permease PerM